MKDWLKITAWKFGIDNLTVKYENADGSYTLRTEDEPKSSLYKAAADVVDETKAALGLNFGCSLSSVAISDGNEPSAAIVLSAETAIAAFAEVRCPKIDRAKILDMDAETQTLPGMDANKATFAYVRFVDLNLALDAFLEEAKAFVLAKPKRKPSLFDEEDK